MKEEPIKAIEDVKEFENVFEKILANCDQLTPFIRACCICSGAGMLIETEEEELKSIKELKELVKLKQDLLSVYEEYFLD